MKERVFKSFKKHIEKLINHTSLNDIEKANEVDWITYQFTELIDTLQTLEIITGRTAEEWHDEIVEIYEQAERRLNHHFERRMNK